MPRNYDSPTTFHTQEWVQDYNGTTGVAIGEPYVALEYDSVSNQYSRTFSGFKDKNWRAFQLANGYLPTRPATDLIVKARAAETPQRQFDGFGNVRRWRTDRSCLPLFLPPLPSQGLADEALEKLRRKVMEQDFNSLTFIAEAGKTIEMIAHTAFRLAHAATALRKGRLGVFWDIVGGSKGSRGNIPPPKTQKAFANLWLEKQYGWGPLISDVQGAAVALARYHNPSNRVRFEARKEERSSDFAPNPGVSFSGDLEFICKAWCVVQVTDESVRQSNRLGQLNPASLAWELLPLSFVADWFLNVNECLQALTAFAGLTVIDGGISSKTTVSGSLSEVNYSPWDRARRTDFAVIRYSRSTADVTVPRLRFKGADSLDFKKVLSSVALLRQRLG